MRTDYYRRETIPKVRVVDEETLRQHMAFELRDHPERFDLMFNSGLMSRKYIQEIIDGEKRVSRPVARFLGFRMVWMYEDKKGNLLHREEVRNKLLDAEERYNGNMRHFAEKFLRCPFMTLWAFLTNNRDKAPQAVMKYYKLTPVRRYIEN